MAVIPARSRTRTRNPAARPPRSISRFRACGTVHAPSGCAVAMVPGTAGPDRRSRSGLPSPAGAWGSAAAAPPPPGAAPATRRPSTPPSVPAAPSSQSGGQRPGRPPVPSRTRDHASCTTITAGKPAGQPPMAPFWNPTRPPGGSSRHRRAGRPHSPARGSAAPPDQAGSRPGERRAPGPPTGQRLRRSGAKVVEMAEDVGCPGRQILAHASIIRPAPGGGGRWPRRSLEHAEPRLARRRARAWCGQALRPGGSLA